MPTFLVLLGGAMAAYFLFPPSTRKNYPLDDTWIHEVYARNLVEGHLFSYNPPEPEAGFSSPLWVLCLASIRFFTDDPLAAKMAGLLFLVLLAWLGLRMGGVFAGILLLLDPRLQFAALSGMEVSLFAFFSLAALHEHRRNRPFSAGLAAALALLSRPEGLILLPILLSSSRGGWKGIARTLLPSLLAAGLWIGYCLYATGRPFPNTFYCKLGPLFRCADQSLPACFHDFLAQGGALLPGAVAALVLVALFLAPRNRTVPLILYSAGLIAGVWATRPLLRLEAFYWERYLVPALAGIHVLIGVGLAALWNRGGLSRACSLCAGALLVLYVLAGARERSSLYELNCRDVGRYNVAAGAWIAENTDLDAVVAVQDAGAIRYYGDRQVLDLSGLNDHGIDLGDTGLVDMAGLAVRLGADYLVLFRRHFSGTGEFTLLHEISYDDYSIYARSEAASLLILKKRIH